MLAAVAALLLLPSCGDSDSSDAALAGARRDAAQALDEVDALGTRLDVVESDLTSARDDAAATSGRLDRLAKQLRGAIADLRESLSSAEESASGAQTNASEALDEAQSIAREVAVLSNRLDYHLRNHGGGS